MSIENRCSPPPRYAGVLSQMLGGSSAARSSILLPGRNALSEDAALHGGSSMRVRVSGAALRDLHRRLDAARWPLSVAGEPWSDGTDLAFMQRLLAYWRREFDCIALLRHFQFKASGSGKNGLYNSSSAHR